MSTRPTFHSPNSTAWATRSPSCRRISMPPPRACSISSASSTPAAAGATASAPAPSWLTLARRTRPGRGPGEGARGARPRHAARAWPRPSPRRAVLRQGPRAHARGDAGDRRAAARGRACRHRRARRAHRARLALHRSQGGAGRDHAAAREPGAARSSRRGRHRGDPWTAGARGGCAPPEGAATAARETLYQRARGNAGSRVEPTPDVSAETPTMAQQQADALPCSPRPPCTTARSGAPGERYQVVVACRRRRAGGSRSARPVRRRRRRARFRGTQHVASATPRPTETRMLRAWRESEVDHVTGVARTRRGT